MDGARQCERHGQWLVGPLVTLAAVVVLLALAAFYDHLPVQAPECGFKAALGLPCVGCGGTRAMRALSGGRVLEAARFNPAVVLGVFVSVAWAVSAWRRFRAGAVPPSIPEQNRRLVRNSVLAAAILLLNWIYLICFLP